MEAQEPLVTGEVEEVADMLEMALLRIPTEALVVFMVGVVVLAIRWAGMVVMGRVAQSASSGGRGAATRQQIQETFDDLHRRAQRHLFPPRGHRQRQRQPRHHRILRVQAGQRHLFMGGGVMQAPTTRP